MKSTMHSDRVSTTGSDSRKSSKPIMEKRRRARINASLAELKSLLLEVIKKEGARHSKMEKADILEMAVKHLRQIQRQQYTGSGNDPTLSDKYRLGFNECAQEVSRYLGASDDDDAELRARLLNHLANCIASADSPSPVSTPSSSPAPPPMGQSVGGSSPAGTSSAVSVTPLTPIPVRPAVKPATAAFSVNGQVGGEGGGLQPSAAVIVPASEINNNIATLANNNLVSISSAIPAGSDLNGGQVTLASASSASQAVHVAQPATPREPWLPAKVLGELQVVPPKTGNGEVAFVLPANLTGGHLPSYIIPVYTSPPTGLPANVSLTPNASAASALPVQLPIMASPQVSVAAGAAGASLVTLTSGTGVLPPVSVATGVIPPASVGQVLGLNGSLSWQPPQAAYSPQSNPTQSTVTSLVLPSSSAPSATVTSTAILPQDLSPQKPVPVQQPTRERSPVLEQQRIVVKPDYCAEVQQKGGRMPVDQPMYLDQGKDVWRPW